MHFKMKSGKLKEKRSIARCVPQAGEAMDSKTVDLFLFMGQSNMAGRGIVSEKWAQPAPQIMEGAGYEYRAISAPDKLYPLTEPFGRQENAEDGINDGNMKTGSLVTAFVNACYQKTGVPIVGVSASKGGSSILQWQPGTPYLSDTLRRLAKARRFLEKEGIFIRHTFMLWCQGETDGDHHMTAGDYQSYFMQMWERMKMEGVERCFLIRIGRYNGAEKISYEDIRQAQEALAQKIPEVVMVSRKFAEMKARGLMKDEFHYYQQAYNEVGIQAGENTAEYIRMESGL